MPFPLRLTRYVTRELLPPLLLGAVMFCTVLSFGYFFISAQFISGAPLALIGRWIAYQLPDTLVKVLPMAVVLMVVVAFGRMATERELLAAQASGISLARLARPAAYIALLITALSLWLSLWVAPAANVATRSLYWDGLTGAGLSTLGGKALDLGNNLLLSLASYDPETDQMKGIRIEQWRPGAEQRGTLIFAASGTFKGSQLRLYDYQIYSVNFAAIAALSATSNADPEAFRQAVQAVFPVVQLSQTPTAALTVETGKTRAETLAQYADAIGADAQGWPQLTDILSAPDSTAAQRSAARQTLSRKLALPFGNLALSLLALPFALRFGRSLGVALGAALLAALAYYLLFFLGLTLASQVSWLSLAGAWLANIVFVALGAALLRRT